MVEAAASRVLWLPVSRRPATPILNHRCKGCHGLTHSLCVISDSRLFLPPAPFHRAAFPSLEPAPPSRASRKPELPNSPPCSQFLSLSRCLCHPLPGSGLPSCVNDSWTGLRIFEFLGTICMCSPHLHPDTLETLLIEPEVNQSGNQSGLIYLWCREFVRLMARRNLRKIG